MIESLQDDGRVGVSELGRKAGVSQRAASERLKQRGIIAGSSAVVDPASVGLGMMTVIRLRATHEPITSCQTRLSGMPQIVEIPRLAGEVHFYLKLVDPSPALSCKRRRLRGWREHSPRCRP